MRIINWIAHTFEGHDGKASFRRMTAFVLICLNVFMVCGDKLPEASRLHVYYANLVAISLIIGIVTTQNILSFFNRGKHER